MIPQILIDKINESQFHGLPENVVADALNAIDLSFPFVKKDVLVRDAREILFLNGNDWLAVVETALSASAPSQLKSACVVLRDTILHAEIIHTTIPEILAQTQAVLGGLVLAGVITSSSQAALLALTERPVSWAEHHGLYPVTARDVGLARGGQ